MSFAKRIALDGMGGAFAEQCGSVVQSEKWFIGGAGGQTLRAVTKSRR